MQKKTPPEHYVQIYKILENCMKPFTSSKYHQQIMFIKLYFNNLSNLKEIVFKELFLFLKPVEVIQF